ncbi:Encoded by, partial [Rhizoctonia solani]
MSDLSEETVHPPTDVEDEDFHPTYEDPEPTAHLSDLVQGSHDESFDSTASDDQLPPSSRFRFPFRAIPSSSLPSFAQPSTASSSTLPTPPVSRVAHQAPPQFVFSQPPAPLPPLPQGSRTPIPPPRPMASSGATTSAATSSSAPSISEKVIVQKISPLKGSDDYAVWSSKINDLLFQLKLSGHINDDYINAHKTDTTWADDDRNALITIRSRVDQSAYIHVMSCTTAKEAWDKLKDMFEVHGMLAKLFQRQKLNNIRMTKGDSLEHHIRKLRTEFETMQRILGDASRWNEEEWITLLIGSLPASWKPVIQTLPVEYEQGTTAAITTKNRKKMVRTVTERLLAKEARLKGETAPKGESGMFNRDQAMRFPKPNGNFISGKKPGQCHNCGKMGHWASECRSSGGEYRNNNFNRGSNSNNCGNSNYRGRHRGQGRYNSNCGQTQQTNAAINNAKDEYGMMAIPTQTQTTPIKQLWIADSGATTHVCNNKTSMFDLQKVNGTVNGVNSAGTYEYIGKVELEVQPTYHRGKQTNTKKLKLSNVAYIPEAPTNLLLVSLVTKNNPGIEISMNELGVKATLNDELVFHGRKISEIGSGGLYQVACTPIKRERVFTAYTLQEWHNILGHINTDMIKKMAKGKLVKGMEIIDNNDKFDCQSCIKGKSGQKPVVKQLLTQYTKIGDLVVSDVAGPVRMRLLQGNYYYVSFTDVAMRYTKIYFMQQKNEALGYYKLFKKFLETQHNAVIKMLQVDNGKEFVHKEFREHLESKGTILRTTAPYSPAQNGIAERLNRTLFDHERCMMFEAEAPPSWWQESTAYACFLKNCTPTYINGKLITPYEAFYGKKPNIVTLYKFGAPVQILDQSGLRGKLDPKTKPAHFVGIAKNQGNSYRYILDGGQQVLHSRNVYFPKDADTMLKPQELTEEDWISTRDIEHWGDLYNPSEDLTPNPYKVTTERAYIPTKSIVQPSKPTSPKKLRRIQPPNFEIPYSELKVDPEIDIKPTKIEDVEPIALSPLTSNLTAPLSYPSMSTTQPTCLNPVPIGLDNVVSQKRTTQSTSAKTPFFQLNKDSGKRPEQIGCLVAKLQGMNLKGDQQYHENSINSDDEMSNTESNSSDSETVLYPKESPETPTEEAFSVTEWHKSTRKLVTLMRKHQTHEFVPIYDIGNKKPSFVGRIVPARSRGVIPTLPISYLRRCASPYDRIHSPKTNINSIFDNIRPFINPVRPEFGAEVFNYASNLTMPLPNITHETFLLGAKGQSAIPTTFEEARSGPNWLLWMPAYNKEIDTFWAKGVWSFAHRPDNDSLVVDSRLQPGKNYNFTNSPTPSLDIICTTMATAVKENLEIHQIDVQSAFLNAPLDEEIYMEMPPGYKHPDHPRDKFVMRLHKAVYGLKQSPQMFNIAYSEQLCLIGYVPHPTKPCVFRQEEYFNACKGEYNPQIQAYTVVDTIDTREFIPIFSNLNELKQTTFSIT